MLGGRPDNDPTRISRRRLIQSGVALATATWAPAFRVGSAVGQSGCGPPPRFPGGIALYRQGYENWAKAIVVDDVWTCTPRNGAEVARLANWARRAGWRLRPRGAMHNWSPILIADDADCHARVVLVDTRRLRGIRIVSTDPGEVRVGAGVSMLELSEALEGHGLGFATLPAIGDPTVGGGLAIGIHGAVLPAAGETLQRGHTYGSLSNMVTSFVAVVWSRRRERYVLRRFHRSHRDSKAFLVHLGRAFLTEVSLRVGRNQNLRCVSHIDIPAAELFAPPGHGGRTFASFIEETGRVESIHFTFTESPWLKVWSVSPNKPASSREVTGPYNYPFSDHIPEQVADLASEIVSGNESMTPEFGATEHAAASAGLEATDSKDIWGKSKDVLFYIRHTTLRVDEGGLALLTSRRRLQSVVSRLYGFYARRLEELRAEGRHPMNGPLEIRACGLDHPADVGVEGAESPVLAPAVPRRDRPEFDMLLWCNPLTFHGTPGMYAFYREFERFARRELRGEATLRTEWSKGWAASERAFWDDRAALTRLIPRAYTVGRRRNEDWNWARRRLNHYDPHRVFSNEFLDRLLPGR